MKNLAILLFFGYIAMAYAAGLLQNEDFSTQAELEARGGSKANLLNDTKVYVTADGLNKRLDEAITDGDLSGGGGDAGINFVTDASFEKEELNLDSSTGATETYETHTTDDKLYSEFNTKYFKSAYTGLSAADLYVRDTFARTGLDDKQGLLSIWIKTDASDLDLCLRTDDATFTNACDSAYLLDVIGDNTWRKYEIPFVFGAASVQFEIFNESYTGDANIEVDKIYVGTIPDGYVSKIDTTIEDWVSYAPQWLAVGTNPSIGDGTIEGNWKRVGDTLDVSITLKIGSTTTFGSNNWYFTLPNNLQIDVLKLPSGLYGSSNVYAVEGSGFAIDSNSVTNRNVFVPYYNDVEKAVLFQPAGSSSLSGAFPFTPESGDSYAFNFSVPIVGWSTDYSTVVTQNTELTAQTANEFSAKINSTGNVTSENYDWIDGNCTKSTVSVNSEDINKYVCNFNNEIFSNQPSCVASNDVDLLRGVTVETTATSVNFLTYALASTYPPTETNTAFQVHCSKQGTDVNKSATIIGKFENINSSDLSVIYGNSTSYTSTVNAGQYFTFDEVDDNNNIWNGSLLTAQRDACYKISGRARFSTSTAYLQGLHKNSGGTTISEHIISNYQGSTNARMFDQQICLSKGDTWGLTPNVSITQESSGTHFINITEISDTQSIVKNLLAESSQTKCQTKFLSGDVTANGTSDNTQPDYIATLDSIEFNNLTVGKRYKLELNAIPQIQTGSSDNIILEAVNSNKVCRQIHSGYPQAGIFTPMHTKNCYFTASDSSLIMKLSSLGTGNLLFGDGTLNETHVTLCQLPDTYVETSEW